MSILFAEYNEETAKRIYAEERIEDYVKDIAVKMLQNGEPIEKIAKYFNLTMDAIERLRSQVLPA